MTGKQRFECSDRRHVALITCEDKNNSTFFSLPAEIVVAVFASFFLYFLFFCSLLFSKLKERKILDEYFFLLFSSSTVQRNGRAAMYSQSFAVCVRRAVVAVNYVRERETI